MKQEEFQDALKAMHVDKAPMFTAYTRDPSLWAKPSTYLYDVKELQDFAKKAIENNESVVCQSINKDIPHMTFDKENISAVLDCHFGAEKQRHDIQLSMYNRYLQKPDLMQPEELVDWYHEFLKNKEAGMTTANNLPEYITLNLQKDEDYFPELACFSRLYSFEEFVQEIYPYAWSEYASAEEQDLLLKLGDLPQSRNYDLVASEMWNDFHLSTEGYSPCAYNEISIELTTNYGCGGWKTAEDCKAWQAEVYSKLEEAGFMIEKPKDKFACCCLYEEGQELNLYMHPRAFTGTATAEQTKRILEILKSCETIYEVKLQESLPIFDLSSEQYQDLIARNKDRIVDFIKETYPKSYICHYANGIGVDFAQYCRLPLFELKQSCFQHSDPDVFAVSEIAKEIAKEIPHEFHPKDFFVCPDLEYSPYTFYGMIIETHKDDVDVALFANNGTTYVGTRNYSINTLINTFQKLTQEELKQFAESLQEGLHGGSLVPIGKYEQSIYHEAEAIIKDLQKENREQRTERET